MLTTSCGWNNLYRKEGRIPRESTVLLGTFNSLRSDTDVSVSARCLHHDSILYSYFEWVMYQEDGMWWVRAPFYNARFARSFLFTLPSNQAIWKHTSIWRLFPIPCIGCIGCTKTDVGLRLCPRSPCTHTQYSARRPPGAHLGTSLHIMHTPPFNGKWVGYRWMALLLVYCFLGKYSTCRCISSIFRSIFSIFLSIFSISLITLSLAVPLANACNCIPPQNTQK